MSEQERGPVFDQLGVMGKGRISLTFTHNSQRGVMGKSQENKLMMHASGQIYRDVTFNCIVKINFFMLMLT